MMLLHIYRYEMAERSPNRGLLLPLALHDTIRTGQRRGKHIGMKCEYAF